MIRIHINGNKLILGPYCLYSRTMVHPIGGVPLYISSIYHKINKLIEKSIKYAISNMWSGIPICRWTC
jgi:hypothetical protein